ncbi:MAG TPA: hypothetical protein VGF86_01445 [Candidatus Tumulicola sp.]|jgi:hypothetical protein
MVASARDPSSRLMGRALLVSLAVHALALALIPALAWTPTSGATVETITFTRIAHIEIEPRRPPRPQPRAVAPHRSAAIVIAEASRVELERPSSHRVASPPPAANRVSSAPVTASAPRSGEGRGGDAAPAPTTSPPPRAVASTVGRDKGGYLPFGAEQPDPVLDPGVRKQLGSLGIHVTLVVTVGEDGRTKAVDFQPEVDPTTQTRIESLLADASWDPAVCGGGISCEGRATIRL